MIPLTEPIIIVHALCELLLLCERVVPCHAGQAAHTRHERSDRVGIRGVFRIFILVRRTSFESNAMSRCLSRPFDFTLLLMLLPHTLISGEGDENERMFSTC